MQVMGLHPKLLYQSKQLHHQLMTIFSPVVTPIFQPINHQVSNSITSFECPCQEGCQM